MNISPIREAVKGLYPNQNWSSQVDRMDDDRIITIYLNNLREIPELKQKEQPPEQGSLF